MDDSVVRCSKYLSYLLRHGASKHSLQMSPDGFVSVKDILSLPQSKGYKLDLAKIRQLVASNDKKRFELKESDCNEVLIRACQGHSIKQLDESVMMTEIVDPSIFPTVVHGTSEEAFKRIKTEGLKVMGRNHIHFAIGYPESNEVISGMRRSCQVFIEIDIAQAMSDGIKFFMSTNKVVLTSGRNGVLEPKYFKIVRNKNRQVFK